FNGSETKYNNISIHMVGGVGTEVGIYNEAELAKGATGNRFHNIVIENADLHSIQEVIGGGGTLQRMLYKDITAISCGPPLTIGTLPQHTGLDNLLSNGDFEAGDPPIGWVSSAATPTQENGAGLHPVNLNSLKITANGAWGMVYQQISDFARFAGLKVTFGAWVYAPAANDKDQVLQIYDGVGTSRSAIVPQDTTWYWLTVTREIAAGATQLRIGFAVNDSAVADADDILYVDGAIVVEGEYCPTFSPKPSTFQTQCIRSIALDLTGGGIDIEIYHAPVAEILLGYTILYSVATGGGAGVEIRVGRYQDGVALDDDYFDDSISEVNKAKGYSKSFGTDVLLQTAISAGDTITGGTAGGKADTGEVMIFLYIAEN
ncbi:MAG: hypothetical protein KAJ19_17345, partial [Gammaproteobacteria bacterium]|nr:hypothetical protein [Gammaproteobacteria bacterium]